MNTKEVKTYRLIIRGKVQGVGFRYWFSNLAISLGLNGYIQNQHNKDEVKAIIQGNIDDILKISKKSKEGPKDALIKEVVSNLIFNKINYSDFIVKYN